MKKINSIRIISFFISLGVIFYMAIRQWRTKDELFYISILMGIVIILLFLYSSLNRKINWKGVFCVIALFLFVSTFFNSIQFADSSRISEKNYNKESEYSSLLGYFDESYNEENQMTATHYRLLIDFIKTDMLEGKQLVLARSALNNYGINQYFFEDNYESTRNYMPISPEDSAQLFELYNPQIIEVVDQKTGEQLSKIYLTTGSVWIRCDTIYLIGTQNGETWFIPSPLIPKEMLTLETESSKDEVKHQPFKINLNFHNDGYMESLRNDAEWAVTEVKNFLYLVYLSFFGLLALFGVRKVIGIKIYIVLALPAGVCIFIINSIIAGLIGIPLHFFIITGMSLIVALIAIAISKHHCIAENSDSPKESIIGKFITFALVLLIFIWFSFKKYTFLSYDSVCNILLGHRIAISGNIINELPELTSYSLFSPFIHMGAKMLRIQFNYSFQPVFTYIGVLGTCLLQQRILSNLNLNRKIFNCIIPAIVAFSYITIPVFRLNSVWILNNLPIGLFIALGFSLIILYYQEKNKIFLILSFVPVWMFSNLRIEGMIFAIVLLVSMRRLIGEPRNNKIYVGLMAVISLIIYIIYFVYMGMNEESIFWNPIKGGAMQIVIIGYFAYILLSEQPIFKKIKVATFLEKHLEYVMIGSILLASAVMIVLKSNLAYNNFKMLMESSFGNGYWGYIWIFLLIVLGLKTHEEKEQVEILKSLESAILGFFTMLFLLMLFNKVNLHAGYGDSAHRMMLHILPIYGLYLSLKLAVMLEEGEYKRERIVYDITKRKNCSKQDMENASHMIKSGCFAVLWGLFKYLPLPFVNYIRFIILKLFSENIYSTYLFDGITMYFPWNISIGHNSSVNQNVSIYGFGGVKIGNGVMIGANVSINTADQIYINKYEFNMEQEYTVAGVIIEDEVWIGDGTKINKGITIGKGAVIGCGSVVTKDIPPYSVAVGVPCKVIKKR